MTIKELLRLGDRLVDDLIDLLDHESDWLGGDEAHAIESRVARWKEARRHAADRT